jgi:hypothetical protein
LLFEGLSPTQEIAPRQDVQQISSDAKQLGISSALIFARSLLAINEQSTAIITTRQSQVQAAKTEKAKLV